MPATVLARGRSLIKARWLQGYGLSETFGPFAWLSEEDHQSGGVDDRVGRIGDTLEVAVLGAEGEPLRPGEVGQIAVRGGTLMQGYCDFEAGRISPIDGWFITGDMGTLSSDGMLRLKGRASEFIKTMDGYKIFPSEVESWLYKLPKIREVAVVGRTFDEEVGEEPIACLYTSEPDRNASLWIDRVSAALEGVLSSEKWPRWIYLTDLPLPKNRNGKIAKRALGTALNKGELVQLKQPAGL
jgi:acyl-CoA synthetase (AMP-forming)/AMP-acid ligase II